MGLAYWQNPKIKRAEKLPLTGWLVASCMTKRRAYWNTCRYQTIYKPSPSLSRQTSLELARTKHKDQVLPYSPAFGTKLGQVLNTDIDYRRALSRKNGSVKAVLTTEKGAFTIDFNPEEAPLPVDNFVKLARSGYFN